MAEKAVLAYSGGLDTSVAVKWVKETHGVDVITLTADLGGEGRDAQSIRDKALGALRHQRTRFLRGVLGLDGLNTRHRSPLIGDPYARQRTRISV